MPFRRALALLLTFAMLVPPPAVADTWGRENYKIEDLATPQLVAPTGEVLTVSPTFSWIPVPGAMRYEIRIETKSGENVFRRDGLQVTTFSVPGVVRFTYGSEYRFTVRAYEHSTHRASAYAPFLSFTPVRAYSNTAPTARASASPDTGFAPLAVFLDASHSTDAQGDALTFAWDVEPDGHIDSTAAVVWHTYATPGEYHPTLAVTDEHGAVGTTSTAVHVLLAPPTVEAAVAPSTVVRGGVALLSWSSTGAQSVVIEPGIGPVASSGMIAVTPLFDTTYTVTAHNASGEASAMASVHVAPPSPVASISISPERILAGGSALLSWSAVDASELTLSGIGPVPPAGSMLVSPGEDAAYTLLARNETGETSASCALSVNTAPHASITVDPEEGFAPLAVGFDASGSLDSDGAITSYSWNFGDGESGSGQTASHTYASPGTYTVTLTVTDDEGASDVATTMVCVLLAPPTVEVAVAPSTVVRGGVALLSWSSTGAQSVVIEPGIGTVASSGTIAIAPLLDTTYTVTARNASGEVSAMASVHVAPPTPVTSISISPERILAGGSALLSWSAVDASELTLSGVGPVPPSGSMLVSPGEDATYTLVARNETGEASASCALSVNAAPRASVTADPAEGFASLAVGFDASGSLDPDGVINSFAWDFGDGGSGSGPTASHTYSLPGTYTITLTVTDDEGASDAATTDVRVLLAPPRVTLAASADYIVSGGSVLIFWGSEGADSVVLSPGIGPVSACGTRAVSPVVDTTYTLTARNSAGEVSKTLVLHAVPVSAMPAGSLGEEYLGLTPSDARVGSYYSPRFSVITGLVRDADGFPLAGVKAVVRGHGEYGSVRTDSSGRFAIPVHGGGSLTLDYTKSGFLSAFRDVPVGWNEVVAAPDVYLVRADTVATRVTYTGSAADVAVHVSTPVSDEAGTRSCAVAITGDTRAYARTASGGEVALSAVTLRATEFATETAMPAALPRLSAYTYCVDISADEATSVRFSKPVAIYVDDFLGFAVGEPVPVGYLDRDRGIWVPCPDGYVVALVDGNGDGAVDGVDATGDGVADDMDGDGATIDDAVGLNDPARFTPGRRSMRVVTDHFSTYDFNFAYGPPDDACAPSLPSESHVDRSDLPCEQCVGSSVDRRNRTFSEDVPLPGTGMSLHYESRRTPGGLPVFGIPLSDPARPASVESVVVRVRVAGRELRNTLPVSSGVPDAVSLAWDGRDFRGRAAASPQIAIVEVGYVYRAVYYRNRNNPWSTNNIGVNASFGGFGILPTDVAARPRYTLWSRMRVHVDPAPATPDSAPDSAERGTLARGWTLSAQHSLSPQDPGLLVKGDGGFLRPDPDLISTVAGLHVRDLAAMPSGRLFTSCDDGGLWLIDPTDGSTGRLGANVYPQAVAVDPSDALYCATAYRVGRGNTSGKWQDVAGNGQTVLTNEDGVPATSVAVSPRDIAVDGEGNLWIAESNRIRRVGRDGIIRTLFCRWSPGGPTETVSPGTISAGPNGSVYFTHGYNVLHADEYGILTWVAGNNTAPSPYYPSVESTVATHVAMAPSGLDVGPDGRLYITDSTAELVWVVDSNGVARVFAGIGGQLRTGRNDGTAGQANLYYPGRGVVGVDGTLYVASGVGELRRVSGITAPFGAMPTFTETDGTRHTLDTRGRHSTTIDALTGVVLRRFTYDSDGRLSTVTDRFGASTRFTYDTFGRLASVIAPDGAVTYVSIDATGDISSIVQPDAGLWSFTYDSGGLMTRETEPGDRTFTREWDGHGRIARVADPDGVTWRYSASTASDGTRITSVTGGEGDTTVYNDRVTPSGDFTSRITGTGGAVTSVTFSGNGDRESSRMPGGIISNTTMGWDPTLRTRAPVEKTLMMPSGLLSRTTFGRTYLDRNGDKAPDLATSTVTLNGRVWRTTRDLLSGSVTATSPAGRVTRSRYDIATMLPIETTSPGLATMRYTWDTRGRVSSLAFGERVAGFSYDASGNLAAVTAPDGASTGYTHDAMGRVIATTRADGSVVRFAYDGAGDVAAIGSGDATHTFTSNASGTRRSWTTPAGRTTTYASDTQGRLRSVALPSGDTLSYTYTRGYLTGVSYPGADIALRRAPCGRLDSIARGSELATYTWDGTLLTRDMRSGSVSGTLTFSYNTDLAVSSMGYAGTTQALSYDADGLLTGAAPFAISRTTTAGLPATVTAPGLTLSRSFSSFGEMDAESLAVAGAAVSSYALSRDLAGRIVSRVETVAGVAHTLAYTYDALGRLTLVTRDGMLAESYAFDGTGRRSAYRAPVRGIDETQALSYDADGRVLSCGALAYTWDEDGRVLTRTGADGVTTYAHTPAGELSRVGLPDGRVITYTCDGAGRRVAKAVDGVVSERYLIADDGRLLATYDGSGSLLARFTYADARVPYRMSTPSGAYSLAFDQTGSLRAVATSGGVVVKTIDRDAFGNVTYDSAPGMRVALGFAGGIIDEDTGLSHFGARDYDPALGRFTTPDPIDFSGGDSDLYAYCAGDPVGRVDPSGLACWSQVSLVAGGIATAAGFVALLAFGAPAAIWAATAAAVWTVASMEATYYARTSGEISERDYRFNMGLSALSLGLGGVGMGTGVGAALANVGSHGFGLASFGIGLGSSLPCPGSR